MEGNGWDKYQIHVLETIKRLETKLDDYLAIQDTEISDLKSRIQTLEGNYRWYTRIFSVIWAGVVVVINYFLGRS